MLQEIVYTRMEVGKISLRSSIPGACLTITRLVEDICTLVLTLLQRGGRQVTLHSMMGRQGEAEEQNELPSLTEVIQVCTTLDYLK